MSNNEFVWHFSQNQFANATRNNFKLTYLLSTDHYARLYNESLSGEVLFVEMYDKFKPIRKDFSRKYSLWLEAKGMYKAQTVSLANSFDELVNKKLPKWDVEVQNVFIEKSTEYISIFPGGRSAFQKGAYDIRISKLDRLYLSVSKHADLKKVSEDILAFYNFIEDIRLKQQALESKVKKASFTIEKSRIKTTKAMYENLALLMNHFSAEPYEIQRFFELQYITNKEIIKDDEPIIVAEGTIEPESKITVDALTGKFNSNTQLVINNLGDTAIEVYTTKLPSDNVPGTTVTVESKRMAIVNCGELGAEENLYLIIYNASTEKTATYSVGVNHYGINEEEIK